MVDKYMNNHQGSLFHWGEDNLIEATKAVDGHWLSPVAYPFVSQKICTDSRQIQSGDIFLALVGDNFDGHDYIDTAVKKGAVAVIVEKKSLVEVPQLLVNDTRLALGLLASYRRQQHQDVMILALTGSSGKTTCKEMLSSIFGRVAPTLVTRGNLNNDLGVPMMLLELTDEHKFAILELGANHLGEIAYTSQIASPKIAGVLNVGTAHLGEFGGREKICQAKSEIYQSLGKEGIAIVSDADTFAGKLRHLAEKHTQKIISYGGHHSDVKASDVQVFAQYSEFYLHIQDNTPKLVKLPFAGGHNVQNALAAAAFAFSAGIGIDDIVEGLQLAKPTKGRLNMIEFGRHCLIDDTYNANPHSVRAAAQVLSHYEGKKILVLGDIAELGEQSEIEHFNLGKDIATMDIDILYCLGNFANFTVQGAKESDSQGKLLALSFHQKDELLAVLKSQLCTQTDHKYIVLFKGSRTMQMETFIHALMEE